jgi:hypothetical protein
MFTRQHYIAIAEIIYKQCGVVVETAREAMTKDFADAFAKDNPRFDRDTFERACRV